MNTKKKIIIGSIIVSLIGAVIVLLVVKKKKKNNLDNLSSQEKDKLVNTDPNATNTTNAVIQLGIPQAVKNSSEFQKQKENLDYINGTLDMMKLINGKIVSTKSSTPFSEGLLQYTWLAHNREFKKITNPYLKPILNKTISRNNMLFNPTVYNYNAQWYKDYKANGGIE